MWLYQGTQRATCHWTSARFFLVGAPSSIASVLNSPILDSHRALSSASPTVPIETAVAASASSPIWVLRQSVGSALGACITVVDQRAGLPVSARAVVGIDGLPQGVGDQ